ncbi:MAG: YeeE/YedE thiosulfate transporter family protein [Hyphomicrobiaceae bacterium]
MGEFTPISAAIGGALIGLAATLLMLLTGRIAGISGIVAGLLSPGADDRSWRLAFIAGLILAPLAAGLVGYPMAPPQLPASWGLIVGAGLLVGFGTRLGGGCTSGHGVCGVARLSARSLVATAVFMATAVAVVAVSRHVVGG